MPFAERPMIWPTNPPHRGPRPRRWPITGGGSLKCSRTAAAKEFSSRWPYTVDQFSLPRQPFDDLLDAFEQDQHVTRYADMPQLLDYCRRSADPVGRLVLKLAGVDDAESCRLSDRICTGLQLANFWQDVARDFAKGRVYLPADAMAAHGVEPSMLTGPTTTPAVRRLVADLVGQTREFFDAGRPLPDRVPGWLAADLKLFIGGGVATLDAIERSGFDVVARRVTVSRWRQARMVAAAWWS